MRLVSNKMIGRGLFVLTILSNCVLSLPVTPSQLENEDVKVMKCIVEALADVLSRPHPMPVSQECLVTLKTDDRLVSILRHHNFLKELQEIAVQGGQERSQLQRDAAAPDPTTQTPQTASDQADRSMLEALGGPGERSILSQKRRTLNGDGEEEQDESPGDEESQEDNDKAEEMQVKRESEERPASHMEEWSEAKADNREEEEEDKEEHEEKRADSEENSEETMTKDKKGAGSGEKRDAPRSKSKERLFDEEDEEDKDKSSALFSHKQDEKQAEEEDEGQAKKGSRESLKRWTKRGKALSLKKKKEVGKEAQQEVPHHSKEVSEEEEENNKRDAQRSPEEKELQMIARRGPEERRGSEEEGSASRKSEEPEIESLAAIESELENVAQKLHELRRG